MNNGADMAVAGKPAIIRAEQISTEAYDAIGPEAKDDLLLGQVHDFIERFVFLKTNSLYRLLALWSVATYMYADFEYTGYIFACSPEPQSGKSRLLEVLELLAAKPSGILVSPSEAVLFRTAEGHTQLLDEVDGWTNRDELRNVLNAGFHRGATVQRMNDGEGGYEVKSFPVYAPRVLAGIGQGILHGTTRDRTFVLEMVRQMRAERRERFRIKLVKPEADNLKNAIEQWIAQHKAEIADTYEQFDFPYLQDFRDRTIDVAQPLAAILEVAYKGRPELERVRQEFVKAAAITRKEGEPLTDDHKVLRTLTELARTDNPLVGNATELADLCGNVHGEKQDEAALSAVLRRYGFQTRSIRKDGQPRHRYSLPHSELSELVARYASAPAGAVVAVEAQPAHA
jgi:hypothetical protein